MSVPKKCGPAVFSCLLLTLLSVSQIKQTRREPSPKQKQITAKDIQELCTVLVPDSDIEKNDYIRRAVEFVKNNNLGTPNFGQSAGIRADLKDLGTLKMVLVPTKTRDNAIAGLIVFVDQRSYPGRVNQVVYVAKVVAQQTLTIADQVHTFPPGEQQHIGEKLQKFLACLKGGCTKEAVLCAYLEEGVLPCLLLKCAVASTLGCAVSSGLVSWPEK